MLEKMEAFTLKLLLEIVADIAEVTAQLIRVHTFFFLSFLNVCVNVKPESSSLL